MSDPVKFVLSIDGGGIRGVIPARILAKIEEQVTENVKAKINRGMKKEEKAILPKIDDIDDVDVRIADLFDMVAGTSTGAIIALGLVISDGNNRPKFSGRDIEEIYTTKGHKIFQKGFKKSLTNFCTLPLFNYKHKGLEGLLRETFGDKTFGDPGNIVNDIKVLIPSFNITKNKRAFFGNYDLCTEAMEAKNSNNSYDKATNSESYYTYAKYPDVDFKMRDALRATSAAPTYFASARIKVEKDETYENFIDGGVYMNNQTFQAFIDAKRLFCTRANTDPKIVVCTLGTGFVKDSSLKDYRLNYSWIKPFISLSMVEQSISNNNSMLYLQEILGNDSLKYYQFNAQLDDKIELDSIDNKNIEKLKKLADDIINGTSCVKTDYCFTDLIDELSNHYIAKMKNRGYSAFYNL